jgi:hypothetical protein
MNLFVEEIYKNNGDNEKYISKIILNRDFYYHLKSSKDILNYINPYVDTIVGIPFEVNKNLKPDYVFEYSNK